MEKIVAELTSQRATLEANGLLEILKKVEEISVRQDDIRTIAILAIWLIQQTREQQF